VPGADKDYTPQTEEPNGQPVPAPLPAFTPAPAH